MIKDNVPEKEKTPATKITKTVKTSKKSEE
jgi:hypothetical protein